MYVNVVLKNFEQMKEIYNFDENQAELLELVMGSGNVSLFGYVGEGATTAAAEARGLDWKQILVKSNRVIRLQIE